MKEQDRPLVQDSAQQHQEQRGRNRQDLPCLADLEFLSDRLGVFFLHTLLLPFHGSVFLT